MCCYSSGDAGHAGPAVGRSWSRFSIGIFLLAVLATFLGIAADRAEGKSFSPMADTAATRYGHTVNLLPNGKVLIAGGYDNVNYLSKAEIYDPATGKITPTRGMKTARMYHTATRLANGRILIAGGSSGATAVASFEIYDPATESFTPVAGKATGRVGHSATLLPSGKVLIAGGRSDNKYPESAELYDPATGTVSAVTGLIAARDGHTATLLPNGKVLIAGGMKGLEYIKGAELFDPVSATFAAAGELVAARSAHTSTLLADGRLLIAGGRNGAGIVNSAEIYDPATARFTSVSNMASERDDHTATLMADGNVLIAGGRDTRGYLNSAELFYPETGTFVPTANMTSVRDVSRAVLLPDNKVLVVGGWDGVSAAQSAETFDPETTEVMNMLHLNTVGQGDAEVTFVPGRSCAGSCTQYYASGTTVRLIPAATLFKGWAGCDAVSGNECVVTMSSNKAVTLTTSSGGGGDPGTTYAVTALQSTGGSVEPAGVSVVPRGDNVTYQISAAPGYHVAAVVIDATTDLGAVTSFTFTNVKEPHSISAVFALNDAVSISAGAGPNGSISPSDNVFVPRGASQTFTITPDAGFRVADVLVDGSSVGAVTSYTFTAVSSDHSISASFTPVTYTITATAADNNGAVEPAGAVSVNSGSSQLFTITPAAGFKVADVLVDGISVGSVSSYSFDNVTADHAIAASFTPIVYRIEATAGENGVITPDGAVSVNSGSSQLFTMTPAAGYKVADVLVDGISAGSVSSYSFINVTGDHAISASFTPIVYTITATAPANGSITPAGVSSVNSGGTVDFTITAAAGFRVEDLLIDGLSVGARTSYSFTNVTSDHTITASLAPIVYTITASAGSNGGITPAGESSLNHGDALTYTITPLPGFKVAEVLVDGASVGAVTSYSFNGVTANHSIAASFTPIVYSITATAQPNGTITPAGVSSVNSGSGLDFTIVPATGYRIADVVVDGVSVGFPASYRFSSVTADHSITASFTPILYTVTASAGPNGSIDPAGGVTAAYGSAVACAITPAPGFQVDDVLVDGLSVGRVTSYSFNDITGDHSISATFTPVVYAVTATAGANGSIEPAGTTSVNHGANLSYAITPASGFRVAELLVDGVPVGALTSYSFVGVTANHSIAASFTPIVYTVTATSGANGSIDPVGATGVNHGGNLLYAITPAAGFKVQEVLVDGVSVGAVTRYSFDSVTADHSIAASFTPIVYTVTSTAGANGSITPSGESSVNHGADLTLGITPEAGFKVAELVVDGVSVGAVTSYTLSNVTADHSVSVSFTRLVYSITATANANGSITPAGASAVNHGAGLSYTITPAAGFRVAQVLVDGVDAGALTQYSFTDVTANHSIEASFAPIVYTLTASAGINGVITPAGASQVDHGSNLTFTITPAADFQVAEVTVDNVSVGAVTTYTFTSVTGNHSIHATFSPIVYAHVITASAGAGGSIAPAGESSVNRGESLTYTITPATGYRVAEVRVDNVSVGAVTEYVFSDVTANHTISAVFQTAYTITASAAQNGSIEPAGVTTVGAGGSQSYTITPAPGYKVSTVKVDGLFQGAITGYTFTNVTANHSIAAYFTAITYTISASAGVNGTVSPAGTSTVNEGTSKSYTITPSPGYHVSDVLVDGLSVGAVTAYTFSGVTASHTISASFEPNPAVTISASAGANGTISPAGEVAVLSGASQAFNFTAEPGYRVGDVVVDGVSKGATASYLFKSVTGNHTIAVTFTPDVFTLTAVATQGGNVAPAGVITVARGGGETFSIIPAQGYRVSTVKVDNIYQGPITSYSFTDVTADHTITAYFTAITYTIDSSAGANGTITPAGSSTVNQGSDKTYTITPSSGYHVLDVAVDGVSVGAVTSYTFTDISAGHTISATFEANPTVIIAASAGANGAISPSGLVQVLEGSNQTFSFTAAARYRVGEVLVDGVSVGAPPLYTFVKVTGNHAIEVSFIPDTYTITAAYPSNGSVLPAGVTTVYRGENVTYSIVPEQHYRISTVIVDGAYKGAIESYSFTDVTTNHTLSAFFVPITYTISASAGTNGLISPSGSVTVGEGTSSTYTITPAPGYHVADVLVDGVSVGAVTSYTFSNVTGAHSISASFAENAQVYITATAGANGTITPAGTVAVLSGASQTFTFTPDAGYVVGDITVDGISKGRETSYTFANVTGNHTIAVSFTADVFTLTAVAQPNGSITPAGVTTVPRGGAQSYTVTPAPGYKISTVKVDTLYQGAISSYSFTNVQANHTITAYFAPITHTITATAGANGSITPSGGVTVNQGSNQSFTIKPSAGFHVEEVLVDGVSVGAVTSYTFINVMESHSISATFAANPSVTITASAGANGTITPAGEVQVPSGTNKTFTFAAAAGFRVGEVVVDGVSKGAPASYTFTNVTANHTITVNFTPDVYTITATAMANGSIDPAGVTTVARGGGVTYIVTPAPGYMVQTVKVDGIFRGAISSYSFTNVTANHTITAYFATLTYPITASSGANGSVTPSGTSNVASGSTKTYSITPSTGYHVNDVLVDGTSVGAVTSYTFADVSAAHTISATFAANTPLTITATAGANGAITPQGSVTVLAGSSQSFTLTPAAGHRVADLLVDGVSVGAVTSYTFTNLTTDHTIAASFTPDVITVTATAGAHGTISPAGISTPNRGDSITYTMTPEPGYRVLDVQVDGIYLGPLSSYTFDNVTANHSITATFALVE